MSDLTAKMSDLTAEMCDLTAGMSDLTWERNGGGIEVLKSMLYSGVKQRGHGFHMDIIIGILLFWDECFQPGIATIS